MRWGARLERKTSEKVVAAMKQFAPDLDVSVAPAPCHIVTETHEGVLFPYGDSFMLAYRCQRKWWGRQITADDVQRINGIQSGMHLLYVARDRPAVLLLPTLGGIADSAATFVSVSRG